MQRGIFSLLGLSYAQVVGISGGVAMRVSLFAILLCLSVASVAQPEIDRLIEAAEPPAGVVFEVIEGEVDALGWALPKVARLSERLRERFPDLSIAVVTHGREQFGLLAGEANGPLAQLHAEARALQGQNIGLHVCAVHASWDGNVPEDFPDYVDVAASAPAQINDYVKLGFELVRLTRDPS